MWKYWAQEYFLPWLTGIRLSFLSMRILHPNPASVIFVCLGPRPSLHRPDSNCWVNEGINATVRVLHKVLNTLSGSQEESGQKHW